MNKFFSIALFAAALLFAGCSSKDKNPYDLDKPFGWAVCDSAEGGSYDLTGGTGGKSITLFNTGECIDEALIKAIEDYDIIILDGSKGEFTVEQVHNLGPVKNKSVLGVNNAVLKTKFQLTEEFLKPIVELSKQPLSSTSGTGGILSNGEKVAEERELKQRQAIIDMTGDQTELYRKAGFFILGKEVENLIFRDITFIGPGAVDVGGSSFFTINGAQHLWIDHCRFVDAERTHIGITNCSDYITISWCDFLYTDKSFNHNYSTLIGGSDTDNASRGHLKVTIANSRWGENIGSRVPMSRFGTIHLLNDLYAGNEKGLNPRKESKFLVEGCYFCEGVAVFSSYLHDISTPEAYCYKDCITKSKPLPENKGEVSVPYDYTTMPTELVPEIVGRFAGPRN